jgi:hypothetical protein
MRKRVAATAAIAAFCMVVIVQPAFAATEVGNKCAANDSEGGFSLVSLANSPGNPPAVIPSSGVITRWTFSIGLPVPPETGLTETLKVFRPMGIPKLLQVVGESTPQSAVTGLGTYSTRIPVQAGDMIGALATVGPSTGTLFCETGSPSDRVGVIVGTAPPGSTVAISEEGVGLQNPVVVFVEPDADNDGYGDETQDACPQSAAFQTPCPTITLDSIAVSGQSKATVYVTASTDAPVKVAGTVKLGKGKTTKLSGGTHQVPAGKIVHFTLKFNAKLKAKLKELDPSQKLTLKITASATNVAGQVSTDVSKVKLKSQG